MKPKLLLGLALVLSGGFVVLFTSSEMFSSWVAKITLKTYYSRPQTTSAVQADAAITNTIIGSTNTTVKLVLPGSSGFLGFHSAKCKIEEVPEKIIFFTRTETNAQGVWTQTNWVSEVHDPYTKKICIIPPDTDFVVSDKSGMVWFWSATEEVIWQRSYFEISDSSNTDTAITQFISGFDEDKLLTQESRVLLRDAAPLNFFWEGSSIDMGSKLQGFNLTDGILRVDLLMNNGKGGKYTGDVDGHDDDGRYHYWENRPPHYGVLGSFWIDLKKQKVIKSVIDGYRMNLHTGEYNFAVPNPFTFPANFGTWRRGILPAAVAMIMIAGTVAMSRKARSKFHYTLSGIAIVALLWSLIMLYRIYILGLRYLDLPEIHLGLFGNFDVWPTLPSPQIIVAAGVGLVALQAVLLQFRKLNKK